MEASFHEPPFQPLPGVWRAEGKGRLELESKRQAHGGSGGAGEPPQLDSEREFISRERIEERDETRR